MTVNTTSTASIRAVFPGWLDLSGRVSSRTLAEYRYDATNYLTYCTDMGTDPLDADSLRAWRNHMIDASNLSPNTINRRLAAIKRLAKASAILKHLPAAIAQEFSLVENTQVAPLPHRLRQDARMNIAPCGRTFKTSALPQGPDRCAMDSYLPRLILSPSS